jgi:uncharacterized protein (DUF302 family)
MFYIVESDKSFYEASVDLEEVILRLGFSVLQIHDSGDNLRSRGLDCDEEAKSFVVDSARLTERLLALDMRLSLALPWRISVFTEEGATKIGLLRPPPALAVLSAHAAVARLAHELEERLVQIVDEAR